MATRDEALQVVIPLTKRLEALRLTGYLDTGGVPTDGYGNTLGAKLGVTITEDQALVSLKVNMGKAADAVARCCQEPALANLDAHQRGALYDFAFNLGADPAWQIWGVVTKGLLDQVPVQMRRFVYGKENGEEVEIVGLEHRREAEIVFWNTADVEAAVAVTLTPNAVPEPPSSYTRAIVTPPAPIPAPPLNTVSLTAKVVSTVAALGMGADQANQIIAPHADQSHLFATASTFLVGIVIVAGLIGLVVHSEQSQIRKT